MDKSFVSVVGSGRHTRIMNNRLRRIQNDHFLKKFVTSVVRKVEDKGLKNVQKDAAKTLGAEGAAKLAADLKKEMQTNETFRKGEAGVIKGGQATLLTGLAGGLGAIAAPLLGGAGAAGGGGAAAAGAGAGSTGTATVVTGGLGAAGAAAKGLSAKNDIKVKDISNAGDKFLKDSGMKLDPVLSAIKKDETAKKLENVWNELPADVRTNLKAQAKKAGKKISETDVIANNRTSPELLPKTKKLKESENEVSRRSDMKLGKTPFNIEDNMELVIISVVVFLIIAMMFRRG